MPLVCCIYCSCLNLYSTWILKSNYPCTLTITHQEHWNLWDRARAQKQNVCRFSCLHCTGWIARMFAFKSQSNPLHCYTLQLNDGIIVRLKYSILSERTKRAYENKTSSIQLKMPTILYIRLFLSISLILSFSLCVYVLCGMCIFFFTRTANRYCCYYCFYSW